LIKNVLENIRRIRREKDLSQLAVAVGLGLKTAAAYQKIESGQVPITLEMLEKLAAIMNCVVADFAPVEWCSNKPDEKDIFIGDYAELFKTLLQEKEKRINEKDLLIMRLEKHEQELLNELSAIRKELLQKQQSKQKQHT